jgi:hypothetical protein
MRSRCGSWSAYIEFVTSIEAPLVLADSRGQEKERAL